MIQTKPRSDDLHRLLMETIAEIVKSGRQSLDANDVIKKVAQKINPAPSQRDDDLKALVLAMWNDLIRCGHLSLGSREPANWAAGPCFLSEVGKLSLEHAA